MTGIVFGGPFLTLYGWACGVGLSRVLLGKHFPGDTIAGALMGSDIIIVVASQLGLAEDKRVAHSLRGPGDSAGSYQQSPRHGSRS